MKTLFAISFLFTVLAPSLSHARLDPRTTAVVIVDMQDNFFDQSSAFSKSEYKKLIDRQVILLSWAESENVPVVFLEFPNYGAQHWSHTHPRLKNVLSEKNYKVVTQTSSNGMYPSVVEFIKFARKDYNTRTIVIGGLWAGANVRETAKGAIELGFDVVSTKEIVSDGDRAEAFGDGWKIFSKYFTAFDTLGELIYN